jgi:hypothetical protein
MEAAMQVDLTPEEIERFIILLTVYMLRTTPEEAKDFTHPDSQLCLKLHDARKVGTVLSCQR